LAAWTRRLMDAPLERLLEVGDVGPVVAKEHPHLFGRRNREVVAQLRACGLSWEEGAPAERRQHAAVGQDPGHHRHPAHPEPRPGQGPDRSRRRQGGRLGRRGNRLFGVGGEQARRFDKARKLGAAAVLDEAALKELLDGGA